MVGNKNDVFISDELFTNIINSISDEMKEIRLEGIREQQDAEEMAERIILNY